jgi:ABC-2 type transport system ATP-binding protein
MNSYALEVKNLVKRYGNTVAINGISFSVAKGEFFGFLGPNGAGKTSTIHAITGIGNFQEGEIKVFGRDAARDYREARGYIGLSPQEFNIDIFRTVRQILDFVGGYFGMRRKEREERAKYLFGLLGLKPHADKSFRTLSGGFKRRVMLARARMHDPELLILDEPTSGVDVELRHDLWRILTQLNKNGKTIFLTTHYLEEAERLCDRIAIIFNGKIVMLESKAELIKDGKTIEEHYLRVAAEERNGSLSIL